MSKPSRIRTPLILLATFGTVLALSAGCSKQAEGERCSQAANGNEDCDDGLVCKPADSLGPTSGGVNRCCSPSGPIGDERCLPAVGNPGTGGSSGSGGSSGGGGGAIASAGGAMGNRGGSTSSGGTSGGSSEGGAAGGSSEGGVTSTGGTSSSGGDTGSSTGGGA